MLRFAEFMSGRMEYFGLQWLLELGRRGHLKGMPAMPPWLKMSVLKTISSKPQLNDDRE